MSSLIFMNTKLVVGVVAAAIVIFAGVHFYRADKIPASPLTTQEVQQKGEWKSDPNVNSGKLTYAQNGTVYNVYTTDGNKVWSADKEVPGADPATFDLIARDWINEGVLSGANFLKDKSHVFYDRFNGEGSDAHTITVIPGADPSTFTLITTAAGFDEYSEGQTGYEKDRNHVYFFDKLIDGADPVTFEVLADGSAKDKYRSYSQGQPR